MEKNIIYKYTNSDSEGNEWVIDKLSERVGKRHWDVNHPDGSHTNVNPESDNPGEVNHGDDNY